MLAISSAMSPCRVTAVSFITVAVAAEEGFTLALGVKVQILEENHWGLKGVIDSAKMALRGRECR